MKGILKIITLIWESFFFSHYNIEKNQKKRFIKNNPDYKKEETQKADLKLEPNNTKKPNSFIVISLIVFIAISLILTGSFIVEKYEDLPGVIIIFFLFLAAAGIIPTLLVQKLFYPKDK